MKVLFVLSLIITNVIFAQEGGKVNEEFLKAVVNIKKDNNTGTGFIIGTDKNKDRNFYLVTNKHMIGSWSMVDSFIPAKVISITIYRNDKNVRFFDVNIPILDSAGNLNQNVIVHKDPSVDVACIYLNDILKGVGKVSFNSLDTGFLCPLDSIKSKTFIGLGSQVFAIGYPANIMITKSNEPIVKTGYLASSFSGELNMKEQWTNRSNKKIFANNLSKYFLVDGLIIPGNSGGPVMSPILSIFYEHGNVMFQDPPRQNMILGIVSYIKPGTGICTVYASDYILELIRELIDRSKIVPSK